MQIPLIHKKIYRNDIIVSVNEIKTARTWQILAVFFHIIFDLEKNRVFFQ